MGTEITLLNLLIEEEKLQKDRRLCQESLCMYECKSFNLHDKESPPLTNCYFFLLCETRRNNTASASCTHAVRRRGKRGWTCAGSAVSTFCKTQNIKFSSKHVHSILCPCAGQDCTLHCLCTAMSLFATPEVLQA